MIGIDLLEVERINDSVEFLNKIAHVEEIEYINKNTCQHLRRQKIAALFCVKEAVMKALGLGKGSGVVFKDIMLCHEESGKPFVKLFGKAQGKMVDSFKGKRIEISLSHTKAYATAIAIIVD